MRFLRKFVMVAIVGAGLSAASYGIARQQWPELDAHAGVALVTAEHYVRESWQGVQTHEVTLRVSPTGGASVEGGPSVEAEPASSEDLGAGLGGPISGSSKLGVTLAEPLAVAAREPRPENPYEATRYDLELLRTALVAQQELGADVLPAARSVLEVYLPQLMHGWVGTAYDYSGTTEVPGEGSVACGYYVSTVLVHAGFVVDRVALARQASEQIARTLVRDEAVRRFSRVSRAGIVEAVREQGPGIYLVGLDTHAGFLVHDGQTVTFCHATDRGDLGVVCEEPLKSPSLRSKYTVLGKIEDDHVVQAWLDGAPLVTAQKGQEQAWLASAEDAPVHRP